MTMATDELITISYSEVDAYRQCPFKHKIGYIDRWSKDSDAMSALNKGGCWHTALELHYRMLRMWREDLKSEGAALKAAGDAVRGYIDSLENEELQQLLTWMYTGYVDVYGADWQWTIKTVENTILLPLVWGNGEPSRFQLKVKIDLIIIDERGRWWIVDHKSTSQLPTEGYYDFSTQFKFYAAVLRTMGYAIHGSIHSGALTKANKGDFILPGMIGYKGSMKPTAYDKRFKRTLIGHTDAQLDNVMDGLLKTATTMYGPSNLHERHEQEDTCQWRCSYTEACLAGSRQNNDAVTYLYLQDTGFTQNFERH